MRVYKHPDKTGWVLARMENTTLEIERSWLPADPAEALALLRAKLEQARQRLDEDGNPIPLPAPLEPEPELDIDDEAVEEADFAGLVSKIEAEITWLEATTPTIADPVVRRIAQENMEMLKAWRYVVRRLSSTEKK